ncbi:MAG: SDR family oxidoreductase, partial [Flammeovirgaceae bacterium]
MKISDKVIWITGASSGIGEALAYECSRQGASLILSARRSEVLQEVKSKCHHPESVHVVPLDLEDYENLDVKVAEALEKAGKVDVLINNGGISQRSLVQNTSIQVDKRLMDINYLGTVALTKALLPHFLARKQGHFAVVTSLVGKFATPMRSSYAAAKHALHGFFDTLRAELHNENIRVTIACPGFVQTNVSKNALTGDGSAQASMDQATANGITAKQCAVGIINAIKRNKE